jgi:hypothetical protein
MRLRAVLLLVAIALPLAAADDPKALISKLRTTKDGEELERVVDRIASVGATDGSGSIADKKYLLAEATPRLEEIAANRALKWSLRGSAIHALRDMGAPRAVLERVVAMALKDPDQYVQSRGEILQNYISSMPEEDEAAAVNTKDSDKAREAIAYLDERHLNLSLDQLRSSALEAEPNDVQALIDAGVDVNAGPPGDSPLSRLLGSCSDGGENDNILATLDVLLAAGANVKSLDDNKNTPMITAAQYCGPGAALRLIKAGADPNAVNGSGVTPLTMALIINHLDSAEAMVSKGGRLTADQLTMVSSLATTERAKAILKKASAKKK